MPWILSVALSKGISTSAYLRPSSVKFLMRAYPAWLGPLSSRSTCRYRKIAGAPKALGSLVILSSSGEIGSQSSARAACEPAHNASEPINPCIALCLSPGMTSPCNPCYRPLSLPSCGSRVDREYGQATRGRRGAESSAYLKCSIYLRRLLAQSHLRGFACWNNGNGVPMRLKYVRSVVLLGVLAGTGICSASAFAADTAVQKHFVGLGLGIKTTEIRKMSSDKTRSARRESAHGERLCRSAP